MPTVNVAGFPAAIAVMASLLLPAAASATGCSTPLRIAWPSDRAPLSSSEQGEARGLGAAYLKLLGGQRPLQLLPVPATSVDRDELPAGT